MAPALMVTLMVTDTKNALWQDYFDDLTAPE
jgi:hypothetical protein